MTHHTPTPKQLRATLSSISREEKETIRGFVAREALEYGDDPIAFFTDLACHGCVSGMISSLCWYSDTHAFFDAHYEEIEELRVDFEESIGEPLKIKYDLKNFFAWFSVQETAYQMACELKIEI